MPVSRPLGSTNVAVISNPAIARYSHKAKALLRAPKFEGELKLGGFGRVGVTASTRGSRVCVAAWRPTTASIDDETTELLEKYAAIFKAADINGDGMLQRDELRALLEKVGEGLQSVPMHWLTEGDLDAIFEQYDRDRNGVIDMDEFMQLAQDNVFLSKELSEYKKVMRIAFQCIIAPALRPDPLPFSFSFFSQAFTAVDVGGDGFIGPNEMCAVLTVLGSPLKSYEEITRLMKKYDNDNSGEFVKFKF